MRDPFYSPFATANPDWLGLSSTAAQLGRVSGCGFVQIAAADIEDHPVADFPGLPSRGWMFAPARSSYGTSRSVSSQIGAHQASPWPRRSSLTSPDHPATCPRLQDREHPTIDVFRKPAGGICSETFQCGSQPDEARLDPVRGNLAGAASGRVWPSRPETARGAPCSSANTPPLHRRKVGP